MQFPFQDGFARARSPSPPIAAAAHSRLFPSRSLVPRPTSIDTCAECNDVV